MKPEAVVEGYLVAEVKKAGGIAYKFSSPMRRGVPDRLCVFPTGLVIFVECKAKGGRHSMLQLKELERLTELGCTVLTVWSKGEVDELVRAVQTSLIIREK